MPGKKCGHESGYFTIHPERRWRWLGQDGGLGGREGRIHIPSIVQIEPAWLTSCLWGYRNERHKPAPQEAHDLVDRVGRGNAVEKSQSTALTQVSTRSSDSSAHPDVVPSDAITCSQAASPMGQGKCCPALFDCHPGLPKEVTAPSCFPLKCFFNLTLLNARDPGTRSIVTNIDTWQSLV